MRSWQYTPGEKGAPVDKEKCRYAVHSIREGRVRQCSFRAIIRYENVPVCMMHKNLLERREAEMERWKRLERTPRAVDIT